jgi:hypothetical protein
MEPIYFFSTLQVHSSRFVMYVNTCISNANINEGHVQVMTIKYVKYEDFVINSFQDNEEKPFRHLR